MTFKTFEPSEKRTNSTQEHTKEIIARTNNIYILNNTGKTPWHHEPTKNTAQENAKCRMFKSRKNCRQITRPNM